MSSQRSMPKQFRKQKFIKSSTKIDFFLYKPSTNYGIIEKYINTNGWCCKRYQPRSLLDLASRACDKEDLKYVYSTFDIAKPKPVLPRKLF